MFLDPTSGRRFPGFRALRAVRQPGGGAVGGGQRRGDLSVVRVRLLRGRRWRGRCHRSQCRVQPHPAIVRLLPLPRPLPLPLPLPGSSAGAHWRSLRPEAIPSGRIPPSPGVPSVYPRKGRGRTPASIAPADPFSLRLSPGGEVSGGLASAPCLCPVHALYPSLRAPSSEAHSPLTHAQMPFCEQHRHGRPRRRRRVFRRRQR